MKIVFFANSIVPVHATILDQRPIGGTETALVRLAHALRTRGHTVYVYTPLANPPLSDPLYLPTRSVHELKSCDVFVAVREWNPVFFNFKAKRRFFWTGDDVDLPQTMGLGDRRVMQQIDAVLCASDWHAQRMSQASGLPRSKTIGMHHAVQRELFEGSEPRSRHRLIYSSTPYRGLEHLTKIFPRIREKFPGAELHICSGLSVYQGAPGIDSNIQRECERILDLFKEMPGCVMHGNQTQAELARQFMRASVLAYPNTFAETGCITALEAQAAGCAIVSSKLGALSETVADAGILIEGDVRTQSYQDRFIEAVSLLFTNDQTLNELSTNGLRRTRDWSDVAKHFESIAG